MNEFYEIKEIFNKKKKFYEITKSLMDKEIKLKSEKILEKLNCTNYLNSKELLSSFLINKFPRDTIGDTKNENNKNLIEFVKNLLMKNYNNDDELKMDIIKYSYYFKSWKNEDIEILKNQIFNEYHQLSVDIANIEENENDKKIIFEETQKKILECAKHIGGDDFINEIKNYAPVLLNIQELQKEYDHAYNDIFIKDFEEKKFDKLSGLLEFMKSVFKILCPNEKYEIEKNIDTPYIIHKLTFNKFTDTNKKELFIYMLNILQKNQSQSNDEILQNIKTEIELKEINFPDIFIKIMNLLRNLIHDLEILQNSFKSLKI